MTSHPPPWLSDSTSKTTAGRSSDEDPRFEDIFNHWVDERVYLGDEVPMPSTKLKRHPPRSVSKQSPSRRPNSTSDTSRIASTAWPKKRPASNSSGGGITSGPHAVRKADTSKDINAGKPHRYFAEANGSSRTVAETPKTLTQAAPLKSGPANPLGEFIPFDRPPSTVMGTMYQRSKSLSGYVPQRRTEVEAEPELELKASPEDVSEGLKNMTSQPQPFQWSEAAYSGHEASSDSIHDTGDLKVNKDTSFVGGSGPNSVGVKEDTSPEEEEEGAIDETEYSHDDQVKVDSALDPRKSQALKPGVSKLGVPNVLQGRVFIDIDSDAENFSTEEACTSRVVEVPDYETAAAYSHVGKGNKVGGDGSTQHESQSQTPQHRCSETETDNSDQDMRDGSNTASPPRGKPQGTGWTTSAPDGVSSTTKMPKSPSSFQKPDSDGNCNEVANGSSICYAEESQAIADDVDHKESDTAKAEPMFDEEEIRQCGLYVRANSECQAILQRILGEISSYQSLRRVMNRVKSQLPSGVLPSTLSITSEENDPKIDSSLGYIKFLARRVDAAQTPPGAPTKETTVKVEVPSNDLSSKAARKAVPSPRASPPATNKVLMKSKTKKRSRSSGAKKKILKKQVTSPSLPN